MKERFAPFIDDLKNAHGSNLVSVILYGSAAAGDFSKARSDYNILVALERISPKDLRDAHATVREWAKLGHPIPDYFTASELKKAADVFPIEFHQMTIAHKVLFGRDVIADIVIEDDFLRHQLEFELRSKLLRLRKLYIPATSSVERLKDLMADSLSSVAAMFRAALLLVLKKEPPVTKHEIIALACAELELDGVVFEKIFNIRENNFAPALDEVEANDLFAAYIEQIEKVIAKIDGLNE